jgi:uncharacterized membrane-anchored protein YitT (DUF2179 family)
MLPKLLTFILIAVSMTFIQIDAVTSDRLLIALFGGCLIGVGMGLCIRSGSVADGIEILALLTNENWFKCFGSHFGINSFFFLSAAWFFGISTAL